MQMLRKRQGTVLCLLAENEETENRPLSLPEKRLFRRTVSCYFTCEIHINVIYHNNVTTGFFGHCSRKKGGKKCLVEPE